nr:hypothetical protein [Tanacetum cinerariifolium]
MWTLVKETLSIRQASSDKEKELWVELKSLFEPDFEEQLWRHTQAQMHDPLEWRLYDICGVYYVFTRDQEIFMLVERDYPLRRGLDIQTVQDKEIIEASSPDKEFDSGNLIEDEVSSLRGIVGNKMLKSFPLPVMKILLPEYFPTASEEVILLLS